MQENKRHHLLSMKQSVGVQQCHVHVEHRHLPDIYIKYKEAVLDCKNPKICVLELFSHEKVVSRHHEMFFA